MNDEDEFDDFGQPESTCDEFDEFGAPTSTSWEDVESPQPTVQCVNVYNPIFNVKDKH